LEQSEIRRIDEALRLLAGGRVMIGARAVDEHDIDLLLPAELAHVARAVPKRRREFATGRALLRALLGTDEAIEVADDRSPRLPLGVVASLAHDAHVAVAAVSTDPAIRAIGIDVEPDDPLSDDMARTILRPEETGLDAHLVFALKEAAYKAWSGLGGDLLDHHDVRVTLTADPPADPATDPAAEALADPATDPAAEALADVPAPNGAVRPSGYRAEVLRTRTRFAGRFVGAAGRHLALVVVAAGDGTGDTNGEPLRGP
jgi:4'-phosphopantetheinyl transferase EntD